MPGIVGLVTDMPRKVAEEQLLKMLATLRHESFYRTGVWGDESLGLYIGWAVRMNSFSDGMPLRNETGEVVLVFSGDEYPNPGTVDGLKQKGHLLDTVGPSYLVHLAEEELAFPASLNGTFHGVLVNRKNGSVLLFNDRYGMQRIYHHQAREGFYFAAEAKAILAVRPELKSTDPQSLGELISCGCVLENRSVFKGIDVLPPASAWALGRGSVRQKKSYFCPKEWEDQPASDDPESYYQDLRTVFSRNVSRYFATSDRIGMSLTGGLDTRLIMAWQKSPPRSLPCYTFGSAYRDCQDVRVARRVASACAQNHQVISIQNDFLTQFPRYAERTVYLTDGCTSVGHSADLYANEQAREIAPIRMTGNYGDEVLRRIRVFRPSPVQPGLFAADLVPYIDAAQQTYAGLLGTNALSFSMFRQAPWHHYGLRALEQSQLSVRTPFLDNEFVQTVFRAPESTFSNNDLRLRLISDGNAELRQIRTDLGFGGSNGSRGAMYRRYQHLLTKTEYAYDYGMPHWMARMDRFLSPFRLERLFLGRHKFCHFRIWYRDILAGYVRNILLDPLTLSRPYLDRRCVESVVEGHLSGVRNHTIEIHKLLSLELLHRLLVDAT